jgi:putative tryptophan/tyrosine transport system substrate-binding protein
MTMIKTVIGLALGSILFALGLPAEAQQRSNVPKIGWLKTNPVFGPDSRADVIRRELSNFGYVEGKNIAFEYRYTEGVPDRLPALAQELVRLNVDVILTTSTPAARAAKNATRTIPIVFLTDGDPVVHRLVDSLSRPGRNITGFTTVSTVVAGKQLELLKETVPKLSRVAVLWTPRQSEQSWKQSQLAARELGLHLHSMEVSNADQFNSAFKEATKSGSGALAVTPTSLANSNSKLIAELAAKNQLPAIYLRRNFVVSGGLMSYGADGAEPYKRVASILDKVLKGATPANLPVEQAMKFELVINLKTAKALGLKIPAHLLMEADAVIE